MRHPADRRLGGLLLLFLALLLLTALLALRFLSGPGESAPAPDAAAAPGIGEETAVSDSDTIVAEILALYRERGEEAGGEIENRLAALNAADPAKGKLWGGVLYELHTVDAGLPIEEDGIPAGLPEDDSLCILVFGYRLEDDGSMAPELVGRCERALACARAYPQAFVAVTGGPTAAGDQSATEAGNMAEWLMERGIAEERILREERALSTLDNARFLHAILTERFPQITSLVIVSSSYHVPQCHLLMAETALLHERDTGARPYAVVADLGFPIPEREYYVNSSLLADSARNLAAFWDRENGAILLDGKDNTQ